MNSIGKIFIYIVLVGIIFLSIGYYFYEVKPTSEKIISKNKIISVQKNEKNSSAIKVRNLLVDMKFDELEKYLENTEETYRKDATKENLLFNVYNAFGRVDESHIKFFNTWLEQIPTSYNAYLARAIYYYHMGWNERGEKWINETSDEQLHKMSVYFEKAYSDIDKYTQLNGASIVSYVLLINLNSTGGGEIDTLLSKALKLDNNSLNVRMTYLISITPRWGGSYAQMSKFLEESNLNIEEHPKLKAIYGYVEMDKAKMLSLSLKYNEADWLLKKSLKLSGKYPEILFELGKNNVRLKRYEEAVVQLSKAIKLNSEKPDFYYWRSKAYEYLDNMTGAVDDILYAYALNPYDSTTNKRKLYLARVLNSQAYKLRKKYLVDEALTKYDLALELDLYNDKIYYGIAQSYILKKDFTTALENTEIAIEVNPNNINNYLLIDYLLARTQKQNQSISYWDKFIELNPNNARGYLERGGAYYHQGDMKKALENAKISADLGSVEGQKTYDKFKHLVNK